MIIMAAFTPHLLLSYSHVQGVGIMRQPEIPFLCLFGIQYMPFKFVPEMTDGSRNRPCSRIPERAYRIAFDLALNVPEKVYIAHLSFTVFNIVEDLFHPAGAFTAGRALPAAFMTIKPCE